MLDFMCMEDKKCAWQGTSGSGFGNQCFGLNKQRSCLIMLLHRSDLHLRFGMFIS